MKNEKNLYIIVGIISVLGCGFLFFNSQSGSEKSSKVTFGQVDHLRQETKVRAKIDRERVEIENYKNAPSLSNAYRPVAEETPGQGGIILESAKNQAIQDSADPSVSQPTSFLESQINARLVNQQRAAQMSALQKKQFIENYKQRALAMGYLVELNDQMIVTRVQKIDGGAAQRAAKNPASIQHQPQAVDVDIMEDESEEYEEE